MTAPEADLLATIGARRSRAGGPVPEGDLASVLRLSTMLRSRRADGRFGDWESRAAPSAGGLHAISLLVLPVSAGPSGLYDDARHALLGPPDQGEALELNRRSVAALAAAGEGLTLQLAAQSDRYAACYDGWETLMWRDAGALAGLVAIVATALGLRSVVLGRHGDDVVAAFGLGVAWRGAGAVHLGS